jgi:glycosyltransferase involved in cell wall biosynthesis
MNAPRTSIITLTKDRPEYLAEAIASVEVQTDSDWEHLVYDDEENCPPGTSRMRRNKVPERRFRDREKHSIGANWNALIRNARGRYITLLDDDNRKHPDFLEKMLEPMEVDPSVEAVTCGWNRIDAEGRCFGERHINLETSIHRLCQDNTVDSNAFVFRRSVLAKIGWFDENLTTNQDWHFVIRLVRHCKVVHLKEALVDYREHPGSRSRIAISQLGAGANWDRIRRELFTEEERVTSLGENYR